MTSLSAGALISEAYLSADAKKTIFRVAHDKSNPYTLLSNRLLRDESIRHSDRGLMCQLLSWSDHHRLCMKALVKKSIEGRDAIRGMLDRLIAAGYLRMTQHKSNDGKFTTVSYQIFEESTGKVVSEIDLSGIAPDLQSEMTQQLDLFSDDSEKVCAVENSVKNSNVNQSANGLSVNGKPDPNNNYDGRSNINNSMQPVISESSEEKPLTKSDLLKKWHIQFSDAHFIARLNMAGLAGFVQNQEQLDRFLIDFNQQHDKYRNISDSRRLMNFMIYLNGIKHTPAEYKKHIARLRAAGFSCLVPQYGNRKGSTSAIKADSHLVNPNPFKVSVPAEPVVVSDAFNESIKGF